MPPKQGLRRSHKKSRKGCRQCKQRHTKCSEERPRCSNCLRLDIQCSYASPASTASPVTAVDRAISQHLLAGSDDAGPLATLDLELLHNYMFGPHFHLFSGPRGNVFRDKYVRAGLTEPYVMHIILSASAFQMALQSPQRPELALRATQHQTNALKLAQPHIASLTAEQAVNMFVFSTMVTLCAQTAVFVHRREDSFDALAELLSCMQLTRGIKAVMDNFWDTISTSWLEPVLTLPLTVETYLPGWEARYPGLHDVLGLIERENLDDEERATLREATSSLIHFSLVLMDVNAEESMVRLPTTWQVIVPQAFVDMVTAKHPISLVVMAYYAMLMSLRPTVWWLRQWPRPLLSQLEGILTDRYAEYLVWPRQVVESKLLQPIKDSPASQASDGAE